MLLLLLLTGWMVGVVLLRSNSLRLPIDLSRPELDDSFHYAGIYPLEQRGEGAFRWTSGSFFVQLPWGYQLAPTYAAVVRMDAGLPTSRELTFLANERPLVKVIPTETPRIYRLLLPPQAVADVSLRLAMEIAPLQLPDVTRSLGVILTGLELRALPFTDWPTLLLIPCALLLVWALAHWRGSSSVSALLLSTSLAVALFVLYATQLRPAPLPYLTMAGFSVATTAVALLLARDPLVRIGLALLTIVISFSGMLWASWLSDDAFISFRYAQNLIAGNGLVYNPGERVEGYTNFLYTMLVALLLRLGGDPVLWSYLSGVGLALTLLLVTYTLGMRLLGPRWGLVAALFLATSQSLLIHSARGGGLETALYALLLLAAVSLYLWGATGTEQWVPTPPTLIMTGLLLALATLTRPEGALLLLLTLFHALVRDLRWNDLRLSGIAAFVRRNVGLLALVGPYLLIMIPYFLWRYSYYGDLLPNTFYAKTGGGLRALPRGLAYSWSFAQTMGGPLLLLCLGGLVTGRWRAIRGWRGYLLLLVAVYTLYITAVGGDHFRGERFFVPLVALIALLLADGLALVTCMALNQPRLRLVTPLLLTLLLGLYSGMALNRPQELDRTLRGMDEGLWIWREIGWWMADHTVPDASIAVTGAGAIAYYGQRTTIDMHGLTDRHIARVVVPDMGTGTPGHEKRDSDYVLNQRQPTYIPYMWSDYFPDMGYLRADYELVTIRTRYGRELLMWKRR